MYLSHVEENLTLFATQTKGSFHPAHSPSAPRICPNILLACRSLRSLSLLLVIFLEYQCQLWRVNARTCVSYLDEYLLSW